MCIRDSLSPLRHVYRVPAAADPAPFHCPRAHCSAAFGHGPPPQPGVFHPASARSPPAVSPAPTSRAGQLS
eukprot:1396671-Lingulodinium_polyedra.AAC.1